MPAPTRVVQATYALLSAAIANPSPIAVTVTQPATPSQTLPNPTFTLTV